MKHLVLRCWWLVSVAFVTACFSPQFQDGQIKCGTSDECPPGLSCYGGLCRTSDPGIDASTTFPLTITLGGNSMGTVTSSPAGINCGTDCTESYPSGTMVTLTATPNSGSTFMGWSGACSGTGTCTITIATAVNVTANFAVDNSLLVVLAGTGSGVVSSNPAGINCGTDCTEAFAPNTMVTLTASAATGSQFDGWSGGGCTGTGTCTVTTDVAKMITATFTRTQHTLTVTPAGNGSGQVGSSPAGIDCGADCTESYGYGTMVTLTATPATGSTFTGWSGGGCSGTGTCAVTMTAATNVTATFTLSQFTMTVSKTGNGTGTVTSSPAGISCGADCTENYDYNTMVTLSATPAAGSTFTGWSGGGCTGTSTCVVTMTAAASVTATFTLNSYSLSVVKAGNGTGTVSATGIDCGSDCTETYNYGTMVTLSAMPAIGSTFDGWSGGGCTGTGTCTVTIANATSVTASFTLTTYTLTVTATGTGSGTISGVGINCGADCLETVDYGTTITLTATPAAGSTFAGWTGGGCSGTGTCTVNITQATSVAAQFTLNTYLVTVSTAGTGAGTVTSNPAGISCGVDCNESYGYGTSVVLTAAPAAGSVFGGWTGGGCTGTGTCTVNVSQATNVTATFTLTTQTLTVTKTGTGTGTVTSNISGINCGLDCTEPYNYGTTVTLSAVASSDSTFSGWSGGGCTGTGTCTVTMNAAVTVTANFTIGTQAMTVTKTGTGAGTVTSNIAGINCGADCTENYTSGTSVILTATPAAGSTFSGWSGGGCTGTGTCTVVIGTSPVTVTATFTLNVYTLAVTKAGVGGGTVTSNPAGISCGADCSEPYNYGTMVTLSAIADASSTFTGWSGGGCTGTGTCTVTMSAATTVTATFDLIQYDLTVKPSGNGVGTVTSNPAGINCGADCGELYSAGQMVTLTATPATGSVFMGWSGDCVSIGTTCTLTMDAAKVVYPQFDLTQHDLSITFVGKAGSGTVDLTPPGITCSGDCSQTYDYGTVVTLTPSPALGFTFTGWSGGGCTGTGTCDVTMTMATNVTATFAVTQYLLTVNRIGNGTGTVTSNITGISCGADCTENYDTGTMVQLTPSASTGSTFSGWTGCTSVTGTICNVTMDAAKTVSATFTLQTYTVAVNKTGTGTGGVASSPSGISCGAACSATFNYGTSVTLTATPAAGSTFNGWSGVAGCGTGAMCTFTVAGAVTVGAQFTLIPPNYVFVTSTTYDGNLGGLAGADQICQTRAQAANLPGNYRAWLSSISVSAISRLGSARGWVRRDGKPVVDTTSDLTSGHMFYPIRLDENGMDATTAQVMTGTNTNGQVWNTGAYSTCSDWTSNVGTGAGMVGGPASANSSYFTSPYGFQCNQLKHLYCFGIDNQAVVAPPTPANTPRRAFTSTTTWTPGGGITTADSVCQQDAAAANLTGTYKALLATTTASAISRFNTATGTQPWARRDNTLITASPSTLATAGLTFIDAAPNGNAANTLWYGGMPIWTGQNTLTTVGTAATTCNDWSSTAGTGRWGYAGLTEVFAWLGQNMSSACTSAYRLVCLQE